MGRLIVLEGLDSVGKSTQIKKLVKYFDNAKTMHFPKTEKSDNLFGNLIAKYLRGELGGLDDISPYLVSLMYACDRNDSREYILNSLKSGNMVLDRYYHSGVAFQLAKLNNPKEKIKLREWIEELELNIYKIPIPDIVIFLDGQGINIENRKGGDREYISMGVDIHESDNIFQNKVKEEYLKLVDNKLVFKIDCVKNSKILSIEAIHKKIVKLLEENGIFKNEELYSGKMCCEDNE